MTENNSLCDEGSESDGSDDKTKSEEVVEEEESDEPDEFIPTPYIFTLKDVFNKPITIQPELFENCKIACPSFYVLLDHTVAILWIIFSGENTEVLQTSHIHWALKFLEGLKDKQNKQTDDVKLAINYLQDILIDMISNLDICELEKRNDLTVDRAANYSSFCDFEGYLNKSDKSDAGSQNITKESAITIEEVTLSNKIIEDKQKCECKQQQDHSDCEEFFSAIDDNAPQPLSDKCNTKLYENKEYPSFILEDILGRTDPDHLKDIVNHTKLSSMNSTSINKEQPTKLEACMEACTGGNEKTNQITEDILNWRENQYTKIIRQLQQMSQLDEAFKNINYTATSDIIQKLENFINQPDPNC